MKYPIIGLKRHTLQVIDHNPVWLTIGKFRCQTILQACTPIAVDVQHIGSTSVPDLPAKPIIDIMTGVNDFTQFKELRRQLEFLGYSYDGIGVRSMDHLFVYNSKPDVRTEHVHIVLMDNSQWNAYIRLRDTLRNNPALRYEYAELKKELQSRFSEDRNAYTAGKHDFIQRVLRAGLDN